MPTPFGNLLKCLPAVVTPSVLYGSASWTLTENMERYLRTERRKMLRMMFGRKRRILQDPHNFETISEESELKLKVGMNRVLMLNIQLFLSHGKIL